MTINTLVVLLLRPAGVDMTEIIAIPPNVGELHDLPRKIALAAAPFFSGQIDFDTHVLAEQALGGN